MTSNTALQKARRLLNAAKAGHTGSLDPMASGLLPLCFGEGTKFSGFLLNTDKRYAVRIRLGVVTDTADAEGAVIETRPVPVLDEDLIERTLSRFRGEILQVPPMYSALKHQGRRLYDLARQGVHVEREPRQVIIHGLLLIGFDLTSVSLDVHCSKGTYIRSLAEDFGAALGCGGHVDALRRTAVGNLDIARAVSLGQLSELDDPSEALLPIDRIVADWPAVHLNDEMSYFLRQGQPVLVPRLSVAGWVRIYSRAAGFLGVGEVTEEGMVAPKRLVRTPVPSPMAIMARS